MSEVHTHRVTQLPPFSVPCNVSRCTRLCPRQRQRSARSPPALSSQRLTLHGITNTNHAIMCQSRPPPASCMCSWKRSVRSPFGLAIAGLPRNASIPGRTLASRSCQALLTVLTAWKATAIAASAHRNRSPAPSTRLLEVEDLRLRRRSSGNSNIQHSGFRGATRGNEPFLERTQRKNFS